VPKDNSWHSINAFKRTKKKKKQCKIQGGGGVRGRHLSGFIFETDVGARARCRTLCIRPIVSGTRRGPSGHCLSPPQWIHPPHPHFWPAPLALHAPQVPPGPTKATTSNPANKPPINCQHRIELERD